MTKKPLTVLVNRRAVLVRLERILTKKGQKIRVDRLGRQTRYLLVDINKNELVEVDVDVETLARKEGALEPWEQVSDEVAEPTLFTQKSLWRNSPPKKPK